MNLDQEECKDRFELYEKRNGRTSYQLAGVKSEKKGYFHKEVNEYGKERINMFMIGHVKTVKLKSKKKLKGALSWPKWYNKSRKYWLTIKDLESLKIGDKSVVLSLHPNVLDGPLTYCKEDVGYRPEIFFKSIT